MCMVIYALVCIFFISYVYEYISCILSESSDFLWSRILLLTSFKIPFENLEHFTLGKYSIIVLVIYSFYRYLQLYSMCPALGNELYSIFLMTKPYSIMSILNIVTTSPSYRSLRVFITTCVPFTYLWINYLYLNLFGCSETRIKFHRINLQYNHAIMNTENGFCINVLSSKQ